MTTELLVDHSHWGQIRVTGDDRIRFLQGMCTADVTAVAEGGWTRAAMLNAKGRVTSVIDICNRGDHLHLLCEPDLADKTIELLQKYAIMDEVEFEPTAGPVHRRWPNPAAVWDAAPIFAAPPGPAASPEEVEIRRIEAGLPSYGRDVSEDYFPFESPLIRHIDYDKGCYLGQEPVSRVHHRGNPNKALRGLRVSGADAPAAGAQVSHAERDKAGRITSSAVSPTLGAIALAYLHRSVYQPGAEVAVGDRSAVVYDLPFAV
ncbi:MAG: glycine cleavage T C-terminal barrel domain-containing protein [Myxococcota bacterium]